MPILFMMRKSYLQQVHHWFTLGVYHRKAVNCATVRISTTCIPNKYHFFEGKCMLSRAQEDYLKAIYELEEKVGIAKTTQLAEKLGIRAATVTEMGQRLSKQATKLIIYKHHQGVRLTTDGRKQALSIIRRHRLLETFLHRTLGLNWDEVHEEAEVLEHHISQRVTKALEQHLDFPKFDPHGEPIPNQEGDMAPSSRLRLSQIREDDKFTIVSVDPISREFLGHLEGLGIGIHAGGRLMAKAPQNGPLTILIDGRESTAEQIIGRDIADHIFVELV
jgi:DtxR family Mn-dependent transcriptional regulator